MTLVRLRPIQSRKHIMNEASRMRNFFSCKTTEFVRKTLNV